MEHQDGTGALSPTIERDPLARALADGRERPSAVGGTGPASAGPEPPSAAPHERPSASVDGGGLIAGDLPMCGIVGTVVVAEAVFVLAWIILA